MPSPSPLLNQNPSPTATPVEGPGFGGLYIDRTDNAVVYVYMVNPSQEAAEKFARIHLGYREMRKIREVRPLQARYTLEQLKGWYRHLRDDGAVRDLPDVVMMNIDGGMNRIEVGTRCDTDRGGVQRSIDDLLPKLSVPADAVVVIVADVPAPWGPHKHPCAPPEVVDPNTGLSSPGFGGLFMDSGTINIYLLEPSHAEAEKLARTLVAERTLRFNPDVRALQGQYTWDQLVEWYELLYPEITRIPRAGVWGDVDLDVDRRRNRLTLDATRDDFDDAVLDAVKDLMRRLSVLQEALVLEE